PLDGALAKVGVRVVIIPYLAAVLVEGRAERRYSAAETVVAALDPNRRRAAFRVPQALGRIRRSPRREGERGRGSHRCGATRHRDGSTQRAELRLHAHEQSRYGERTDEQMVHRERGRDRQDEQQRVLRRNRERQPNGDVTDEHDRRLVQDVYGEG